MGRAIDLTGRTFGRLTVKCRSRRRHHDVSQLYYDCDCSCGKTAQHIRGDLLRNGDTRSCGCLRVDTNREMLEAKKALAGGA